jgi:long-chain fatty acid transport protein
MRRRACCVALATLALALALTPRPSRANPPDTFGFGSRETAMGGAVSAEVRGPASGYYNPAALARSRGLELSLGYVRADHHLALNGRDTGTDPVKGVNAGLVVPGRLFSIPFAFGLALHLPDDRISRVRALRQELPRWELYDNRNQRLFLAANLAIEPVPGLALGGGVSFMSSTRGRLDITGGANIFRPEDSQLRHEVDADLTAVRYPQAGARWEISPDVAVAAVYRGQFQLGLDLDARLAGDITGLTTALYALRTSSVNNFLPQQVVLGGSWRVARGVRATFDATWIDWSAYVAPASDLDVVLDIPAPAGGWPAAISPPRVPQKTRILPIRMQDRIVPRMGVEWCAFASRRFDFLARAGYELARSPIPAQTGATNYVDRDRHTGSVGFGVALRGLTRWVPGAVSLDAHLQWSELPSGEVRKASPADLVGDYTAGGRIVALGATLGVAFDPPAPGAALAAGTAEGGR